MKFRRQCKTKKLLVQCNTPPKLRDALLQGIQNIYNDNQYEDSLSDTRILDNNSSEIIEIIHSQKDTGWNYFIRGKLAVILRPYISNYFKDNKLGKTFNATVWYRNFISEL